MSNETSYVMDIGLMSDVSTGEITLESVAKYAQATASLAKATEEHLDEMQDWLDVLWLLLGSYLVFFMQVRCSFYSFFYCCSRMCA